MPSTREESVLLGVSWEAENLRAIQKNLPQVTKAHINPMDMGQIFVQIKKQSEDDPERVIDFVLEFNPYTKSVSSQFRNVLFLAK